MFTGIITAIGEIVSLTEDNGLTRLVIASDYAKDTIAIGASIAHNGICLTVTTLESKGGRTLHGVDASQETISRTTLGAWKKGDPVNLERSLKVGDELGGHIVTGHVDAVARITKRDDAEGATHFWVEAPEALAHFIAEKGSVALDGTSLTVNEVKGNSFRLTLIPHTLQVTTWGARKAGDALNIEVDMMARYAARLAEGRTKS